ncbi:MAG: TonB-dependent hemoglobin/transferrin/lactoferrin family receptor [Wenzhouxiangellaceae bacterium]
MSPWPYMLAAAVQSAATTPAENPAAETSNTAADRERTTTVVESPFQPLLLEPISVFAARSERPLSSIAGSVTIIDEEEIDRRLMQDIQDLVRYEPGLSVANQGSRFGLTGLRIRGIGGNRVLTEIDGVPVSDGFAIGDFSNAGRDVIDVDLLKQAEILRGPASTLYGSRAIGGVVSLVTKDPRDFDYRADADFYTAGKVGFNSDDNSWLAAATGAWHDADNEVMLHYIHRDREELDNPLEGVAYDPLSANSDSALFKWVNHQLPGGPLRLTLDATSNDSSTDVQSLLGVQDFSDSFGFPYFLINDAVLANDEQERLRASLEYTWQSDSSWLSRLVARTFWQQTRATQATTQRRTTLINGQASPALRERVFSFNNRTVGAEVVAESEFRTGDVSHRLIAGSDLLLTRIDQLRSGFEVDLNDGSTSPVVGPDTFPVRDFPVTDILELGFFVQDEIELFDGRLTLIPGLRLDIYDLDPDPDAIFLDDNPGIEPVDLSAERVTPRLGLLLDLTKRLSFFAQYAQGFRAPPFNDVNVGFTNFQFGYTSLPNPDLKPETSDSLEAGFRWRDRRWSLDVTGFYNEYDDFIESLAFAGIDDRGLIIFQSRNIDQATIYGIEGRLQIDLDQWLPGLSWFAKGNWTRGDNDTSNQPLLTVDPVNIASGLSYRHPSERFGLELLWTGSRAKDRLPDDVASPLFATPGYGVLDLTAYYAFSPNLELNLGLFNIGDKTYWNWADVQGRPADDSRLPLALRPGRNVSARLRFHY